MNHFKMSLLDAHTHQLRKGAIVDVAPATELHDGFLYSKGIHPWRVTDDADMDLLKRACMDPRVVAIGECGLDNVCDSPMELQERLFRQQISLSEELKKPLIIHCVRAHDRLLAIRREMDPQQAWIFHGFRLKPTIARRIIESGMYVSLGSKFNEESAIIIPEERLLIETDDDPVTDIEEVATRVGNARGTDRMGIETICSENLTRILTQTLT